MTKNKIIDLFCGAGGLSLGFENAGYRPIIAIDFWEPAIDTYNFNRKSKVAILKDITTLKKDFFNKMDLSQLSGIIGGPPCQGFSLAGKRIIDDERNKLYRDYFRIIKILKPDFFLIENVPGLLNLNHGVIKNDIIKRSTKIGYCIFYKVLKASDYGVPQDRKRVFFVAIKKSIVKRKGEFIFPKVEKRKISCYEALSDLPSLDKGEKNTKYICSPKNSYQRLMRKKSKLVSNHEQTNHSKQTIIAIKCVPEGGNIKDIPKKIKGKRNYSSLLRRMDKSMPGRTIDTGHRTYFHYSENRIISVREAARLQSFPDNYIFCSSKQNQYKQVGNAVPPILASKLAQTIKKYLKG